MNVYEAVARALKVYRNCKLLSKYDWSVNTIRIDVGIYHYRPPLVTGNRIDDSWYIIQLQEHGGDREMFDPLLMRLNPKTKLLSTFIGNIHYVWNVADSERSWKHDPQNLNFHWRNTQLVDTMVIYYYHVNMSAGFGVSEGSVSLMPPFIDSDSFFNIRFLPSDDYFDHRE